MLGGLRAVVQQGCEVNTVLELGWEGGSAEGCGVPDSVDEGADPRLVTCPVTLSVESHPRGRCGDSGSFSLPHSVPSCSGRLAVWGLSEL